jgi:hypothetical protein
MIDTYGYPNWGHQLDIGSVITEVTISSPRGEGGSKPEVQQTVTTSFGELDILALMPPDPRRT